MKKQTNNYYNDEEMQTIIKAKQRTINIIKIPMYLSLVGLILPIVIVIWLDIYDPTMLTILRTIPVASIAIGFALAMIGNKKMNDLKAFIGRNIVLGVLEEKIQVIDYMPSEYVDEEFLKNCSFLPNYNSVTGSDYIHGIYRNVEFTYCDLELKLESQDYTANENNMKMTVTNFAGQFMTVSLNKSVNGYVLIKGKRGSEEENCLETGDRVFDKRFDVIASDETAAQSVLTPKLISGLKKLGKRTSVQFAGDTAVVACNNDKNLFETKRQVKDKSDIELCRQEFRKELSDVLAILDIMIDGCQNNLS